MKQTYLILRSAVIAFRILLIFVFLVNSLGVQQAIAKPEEGNPIKRDVSLSTFILPDLENSFQSHFIPNANTIKFSFAQIGQKTNKAIFPKFEFKPDVQFYLQIIPSVIRLNEPFIVRVRIQNDSNRGLGRLDFTDDLESGLQYVSTPNASVVYDPQKKSVSRTISFLPSGSSISFDYSLKITQAITARQNGEFWIHSAELKEYQGEYLLHAQQAIGLGIDDQPDGVRISLINPEGGWNHLKGLDIYVAKDVIEDSALLMASPTKIDKGPAVQFKLQKFRTTPLKINTEGKWAEQKVAMSSEAPGKFNKPVVIKINWDSIADLKRLPAGKEPYVATYDEEHEVWIKVPIREIDYNENSVSVETTHFSVWGTGLGDSLPQNGTSVLLFDQPYTSLFTGAARYSIPIWVPQGRTGMQPDINLSYSSGTMNGLLGDVQASWVGMGWNIDAIEIVRKITTDSKGYGYKNQFVLTLNGTVFDLIRDENNPARYYVKKDGFLYIVRHNISEAVKAPNTTGEWWEVVTTDGMRYRLGWNDDSEQTTLMYGYSCTTGGDACDTPDGAYAPVGYAGIADNLVSRRWRVDQIMDTHGNYIQYCYSEPEVDTKTLIPAFDRESYLQSIQYTGYKGVTPDLDLNPTYQVFFEYGDRSSIGDVPTSYDIWDYVDKKYLNKIVIRQGEDTLVAIRTYDFDYDLAPVPNTNGTLVLKKIAISGGGIPKMGCLFLKQERPPRSSPTPISQTALSQAAQILLNIPA